MKLEDMKEGETYYLLNWWEATIAILFTGACGYGVGKIIEELVSGV